MLTRPAPPVGLSWGTRTRLSSSPPLLLHSRLVVASVFPPAHAFRVQANCTFIGCGRDQNKHLMAHYNLAKKVRPPPLATCVPA